MTKQYISPSARFAAPSRSRSRSEAPSPSRRKFVGLVAGGLALAGASLGGCGRDEAERPWQGSSFPAFALPGLDGAMHDSREYFGRPLLINFWATWCPPCRGEMADLVALARALAPKGLLLLAVSVDTDRNLVKEYLRDAGLDLTVLLDADQAWSTSVLRVAGFPTTYLVGRDRVIRDAWLGPRAWAEPSMQAAVAARAGLG